MPSWPHSRNRVSGKAGAVHYLHFEDEDTGETKRTWERTDATPEEPWRGVQQLRNLGRSLARVHGRGHIAEHEIELLRRVVLSSMPRGWADVLALVPAHPDGLTCKVVAAGCQKSYSWARKALAELMAVKILQGTRRDGDTMQTYEPVHQFRRLLHRPLQPLDHIVDLGIARNSTPTNTTQGGTEIEPATPGGEFRATDTRGD
jgi:hypothetical protein